MQCVRPVSIRNPALDYSWNYDVDPEGNAIDILSGEVIPPRIPVPCGHCVICQENRRNMWADRLELESRLAPVTFFVTLTYDDEHYPGELKKRDTQLFFKRLRKRLSCRFFLCGEYGDRFQRAHYHAVIFPSEAIPQEEFEGIVNDSWRNGFVRVRLADREAFRYVAKYTVKSVRKCPEGLQPPFALMSRRPGISADYVPILQDFYHEYILLANGARRPLPDYILSKLDPVEGIRIKEHRREYVSCSHPLGESDKQLRVINLERRLKRQYIRKYGE